MRVVCRGAEAKGARRGLTAVSGRRFHRARRRVVRREALVLRVSARDRASGTPVQNNHGAIVGAVVGGVLAYAAFLGTILYVAIRWSRGILERKAEAFATALVAAGARFVQHGPSKGLYAGREAEYELRGMRVFVNAYYVNRSWVRLNLRLASGVYPWVTLYPEGALDRLGKSLALNREVQLGDEAFDAAVYIHSTEKRDACVRDLLAREGVRAAVRELLAGGYRVQFSAKGVEAYQTQYALQTVGDTGALHALELLARIAAEAPRFDPATLTSEPMPANRRVLAVVLASIVGGLARGGGMGFGHDQLLDADDGGRALGLASLLWVPFVVLMVPLVRGRSNSLALLVMWAFVGLAAFPFGLGPSLLVLNKALDDAPAQAHVVDVLRVHPKQSDLHTTTWRAGRTEERFVVPRALLQSVRVGDRVVVRTHPGRFGWQWFEPVTVPEGSSPPRR